MSRPPADPLDELAVAIEALARRPSGPGDRRHFQQYLDLFLRWNRIHRMTALGSPGAIIRELFIDSLLFLPLLPPRPLALVDIGAGAGIPGLPLRLVDPGISLTLVEARRKRASFLLTVRRELGLEDVVVREGLAEDLAEEDPGLAEGFDAVVARAVGRAEELLAISQKYLKPGGLFIVSGPPHPPSGGLLEPVRVPVPGTRRSRVFLKAVKES